MVEYFLSKRGTEALRFERGKVVRIYNREGDTGYECAINEAQETEYDRKLAAEDCIPVGQEEWMAVLRPLVERMVRMQKYM